MTRHHLLHVYTGLRAEIERLSSAVNSADADASAASMGLSLQPRIITDISKLICDANGDDSTLDSGIH